MIRSHKIRLKTNKVQEQHFRCSCGCARQAYNWAVARTKEMLDVGEKPTDKSLKSEFSRIKREQFPWQMEVTKCAAEGALANFAKAKKRFFNKTARFPTFHKRGRRDSFSVDNSKFRAEGKTVVLPKIGRVRMAEELRFAGKIMSAVVSCTAGKWFISIAVEFDPPPVPVRENQAIGVDLGIKHLAVLSNGERYEGPKALKTLLPRLRLLSKAVSRKQKGSANRRKAVRRLSRLHYRIKCVRDDYTHKLTTDLVRRYTDIGIENLNVSGMMKNRRLSRHIADQSFREFRRQVEYKAPVAGARVHVADRFFPSSKRCRACGTVRKSLKLSERSWTCDSCGSALDRDINAAGNLEDLAAGLAVTACGVS